MRAQIVDREAHALSDGADGFEEMLAFGSARLGMDHHIGRHNFADAFLDRVGEFVDLLEARGARNAHRSIDEVAIPCPAHADANNIEHAVHA